MTQDAARSETGDPFLLTPGPLTTSRTVKAATLHDWGSRDATFIRINRELREQITALAGGTGTHTAVPMQGSGTFAVEAMITTFVPRGGKLLVLINGAYGSRALRIASISGRATAVLETPEDVAPDLEALARTLERDPAITHVFAVHCETTSGILNPIAAIARITAQHGRKLLVNSMSAFGALPISATEIAFEALASSSNKCLEGIPGLGYVVCRIDALAAAKGNASSLSLDLHDQWAALEKTGQYRFTPPIQAIVALHQAVQEFHAEGGQPARLARYADNARVLIEGMRALGFRTLLPDAAQAPIIVTFHMPADPQFDFQAFYDRLKERGYVIYPGKLTVADSFRIGCIGRLDAGHMRGALAAIRAILGEMGVASGAPKREAA